MIKAIIFDCFGVLTADKWREFCAALPVEQAQDANDIVHAYDAGFISKAEFLDGVQEATGHTPQLLEDLLAVDIAKNGELLGYIADLKKTYSIGLLSNISDDWVTDHFLSREEQGLFDAMIFSHSVGLTKPDPRIFRLMAERLHVSAGECLMIDDVARNCRGAQDAGMRAIVYENMPQLRVALETALS